MTPDQDTRDPEEQPPTSAAAGADKQALLAEYQTLRAEIQDKFRQTAHLRLAVISSAAVLLGLAVAGGGFVSTSLAIIVPFMLFVLCLTATAAIREAKESITVKSVYIEHRLEHHPRLGASLRWETTTPHIYANRIYGKSIGTLAKYNAMLIREPVPWIALLIPACTWPPLLTPAGRGDPIFVISAVVYHLLFLWLVFFMLDKLRWPPRRPWETAMEGALIQVSSATPPPTVEPSTEDPA